jgi:Domain of unknown function (DUF3841)
MRLWTYQHPKILETLQSGKRYTCQWEGINGEYWINSFRFMCQKMTEKGIQIGENPPIWAWHSVNRLGEMPDEDCGRALLSDDQLEQGIDLLQLEVPENLVLLSNYGPWNAILDVFYEKNDLQDKEILDCFTVDLKPRRGRPPQYFKSIQACLPYIEPEWLVSKLPFDAPKMIQDSKDLLATFMQNQSTNQSTN